MTIGVLCGIDGEAGVLDGIDGVRIYTNVDGEKQLRAEIDQLDALVAWGTCGGLTQGVSIGDLVIGSLVHVESGAQYEPDANWTQALRAAADELSRRSGVKVHFCNVYSTPIENAATPDQRAQLSARTGCQVVEVESSVIAPLAKERGVPFIVVRAVSDDCNTTIPPADVNALNPDGSSNLRALIQNGVDLSTLGRLADDYGKALDALLALRNAATATLQRIF
jgi:adenosylhomocysteine nucleosidase